MSGYGTLSPEKHYHSDSGAAQRLFTDVSGHPGQRGAGGPPHPAAGAGRAVRGGRHDAGPRSDRKAAAFLLGDNLERTTQGGGIYTYTSQQGAAAFRDTGSFDAAGSLSQENAEAFCRDFCKAFSYDTPIFTLDETGSGTATAVRLWNGTPVFNAAVTFTINQGRVLSASGALLPETGAETSSGQKPLSAFAALTAFQQMRHASSSVVSSITEVSLCYELQSTTAAPMALVPSWRIVTDTATFYVNCISGTVRRA